MSDTSDTNSQLDQYGVWVKTPPQDAQNDDTTLLSGTDNSNNIDNSTQNDDFEAARKLTEDFASETETAQDSFSTDFDESLDGKNDSAAFEIPDLPDFGDSLNADAGFLASEEDSAPSAEENPVPEVTDTVEEPVFEDVKPSASGEEEIDLSAFDFDIDAPAQEEETPAPAAPAAPAPSPAPAAEEVKPAENNAAPDFADGEISLDEFISQDELDEMAEKVNNPMPVSDGKGFESTAKDNFVPDGEIPLDAFLDMESLTDSAPAEVQAQASDAADDEKPLDIDLSFEDDVDMGGEESLDSEMPDFDTSSVSVTDASGGMESIDFDEFMSEASNDDAGASITEPEKADDEDDEPKVAIDLGEDEFADMFNDVHDETTYVKASPTLSRPVAAAPSMDETEVVDLSDFGFTDSEDNTIVDSLSTGERHEESDYEMSVDAEDEDLQDMNTTSMSSDAGDDNISLEADANETIEDTVSDEQFGGGDDDAFNIDDIFNNIVDENGNKSGFSETPSVKVEKAEEEKKVTSNAISSGNISSDDLKIDENYYNSIIGETSDTKIEEEQLAVNNAIDEAVDSAVSPDNTDTVIMSDEEDKNTESFIEEPVFEEKNGDASALSAGEEEISLADFGFSLDESPAEENTEEKTADTAVKEAAADDTVTESPVTEEAVTETSFETPVVEETPAVEEPVFEEAAAETSFETPSVEEDSADLSDFMAPEIEETTVEEMAADSTAVEEPVFETPVVEEIPVEETVSDAVIDESEGTFVSDTPVFEESVAAESAVEETSVENNIPDIEIHAFDDSVIEESPAAETMTEAVTEDAPVEESTAFEAPEMEEPVTEEVSIEENTSFEASEMEETVSETPVEETSAVEAFSFEEPVIEEAAVEESPAETEIDIPSFEETAAEPSAVEDINIEESAASAPVFAENKSEEVADIVFEEPVFEETPESSVEVKPSDLDITNLNFTVSEPDDVPTIGEALLNTAENVLSPEEYNSDFVPEEKDNSEDDTFIVDADTEDSPEPVMEQQVIDVSDVMEEAEAVEEPAEVTDETVEEVAAEGSDNPADEAAFEAEEGISSDEPVAEEVTADEPLIEEPFVDETPVEETPAEETVDESTIVEEPEFTETEEPLITEEEVNSESVFADEPLIEEPASEDMLASNEESEHVELTNEMIQAEKRNPAEPVFNEPEVVIGATDDNITEDKMSFNIPDTFEEEAASLTDSTIDREEEMSMEDENNEILRQIAGELSNLKSEINSLKSEFEDLKNGKTAAEKPVEEKSAGFFGDDDDDDTVALSGDELTNILCTADFTEEKQEDVIPEEEAAEETPASDEPKKEGLMNEDDLSIVQPSTLESLSMPIDLFADDVPSPLTDKSFEYLSSDVDDDVLKQLENEKAEALMNEAAENSDASVEESTDSEEPSLEMPADDSAEEEDESLEIGISEEPVSQVFKGWNAASEEETEVTEETPAAEETVEEGVVSEDENTVTDNEASFVESEVTEAEAEETSAAEDNVDADVAAILAGQTGTESAEEEKSDADIDVSAILAGQTGSDSSEESSEEDELKDITLSQEEVTEVESHSELNVSTPEEIEGVDSFVANSFGTSSQPVVSINAAPAAAATETEVTSIPKDMKDEIKSVLSYMDQLLENLPEDKIAEFAQSEQFETYKKLFSELGLA